MTDEERKTENKEEELIDKKGNTYNRELSEKAMVGDTKESNEIVKEAREIYLNEIRYRKKIQMTTYANDVYLISQNWYNKWKKYVRYPQIKKTSRNPEIYIRIKPLIYTPNPEFDPGKIINKDLISDSTESVIHNYEIPVIKLFARYKIDYRILPKESFEILNKRFGCDYILKGALTRNRMFKKLEYNFRPRRFNLILLPTKKVIKTINHLYEVNINIPEFTVEDELKIFLAKIFNADYNKKFKELIGYDQLNENSIKIYHLLDDNTNQGFKQFFESNLKNLQKGEKVDASEHLRRLSEKFQISQFQYYNLVVDFSKSEEEELFSNINIDIEKTDEPTNNFKSWESNNVNEHYGTATYDNQISTYEYTNEIPTQDLSNFTLDKNDNKHGLVGLDNLGNTCYMNTAIQCLSNCKILTNYFLDDSYPKYNNNDNSNKNKGKIVNVYSELIKHIWYGKQTSLMAYDFKNTIGEINPTFKGNEQQDSQEFLSFLLHELHEDLNKVLKTPDIKPKDNLKFLTDSEEFNYHKKLFLAENQSLIVDLFYGMFKSILYCPNQYCNNISNTYDPFSIISLPLTTKTKEENEKIEIIFSYEKLKFKMISFEMDINHLSIKSFRQKINFIFQVGVYGFEMFFLKEDNSLLFINENKYNSMKELVGKNKKIFLRQVGTFLKDQEEIKHIHDQILASQQYIYFKEKEFAKEIKNDSEEQIDQKNWIRCVFENYSYTTNSSSDEDISNYLANNNFKIPLIFYVNKDWNNKKLFDFFLTNTSTIYEDNNSFLKNLNDYSADIDNYNKEPNFNLNSIEKEKTYPFILFYNKVSLTIENEEKSPNNNNNIGVNLGNIFSLSNEKYLIKEEINKIELKDGKTLDDYQLNFNIIWNPDYLQKINNYFSQPEIIRNNLKNNEKEPKLNLLDLLQNFGKKEKLTESNQWYCPKCKTNQLAEKQILIYSCPEILIIHLKRFNNNEKLGNWILFPITNLDMGKYIHNKEENNIYDLFAVANHQGALHGGHYYAYCKNEYDKQWYTFNDSSICDIEENNIVSKYAYILFYKKRQSKYPNLEELYNKPLEEIKGI